VDELASAARVDPLAFRLDYLTDSRGIAVLKAMAAQANWGNPFSPNQDGLAAGRGIAYLQYENTLTYVAAYAEVLVNPSTGVINVTRVVIAHDCGQIINPDGLKNQIEGNAIQGMSWALFEEVDFNGQGVTNGSWQNAFNPGGYRILHFDEIPQSVEIVLIHQPALPPVGAGEPVTEAMPAVIGNAVFNAVGARLRTMPFAPSRVLAAINGTA
jgi:nicotinate dehydrogenase subunit B